MRRAFEIRTREHISSYQAFAHGAHARLVLPSVMSFTLRRALGQEQLFALIFEKTRVHELVVEVQRGQEALAPFTKKGFRGLRHSFCRAREADGLGEGSAFPHGETVFRIVAPFVHSLVARQADDLTPASRKPINTAETLTATTSVNDLFLCFLHEKIDPYEMGLVIRRY